mgnify:FL=1
MVKFQTYFAWFSLKNNHFLSKMLLQLTVKRTEKPRFGVPDFNMFLTIFKWHVVSYDLPSLN